MSPPVFTVHLILALLPLIIHFTGFHSAIELTDEILAYSYRRLEVRIKQWTLLLCGHSMCCSHDILDLK